MDVAPWDEHWIKMVLDGIAWYSMVSHGIECYRMILDAIAWYSMVFNVIA